MSDAIPPVSRVDRVGVAGRHGERFSLRAQIASFSWAIVDQGLFAASNFALNVMLARWLPVRDYGSFSFAFAIFLIIVALYGAIAVEPMVVFGSKQYAGVFGDYLRRLLTVTLLSSATIAALLAGASVLLAHIVSDASTLSAMFGFWMLAPVYLAQYLLRRACYVVQSPQTSALGTAAYSGVLIAGTFVIWKSACLSIWTLQAVLGLACLVAATVAFRRAARSTNPLGRAATAKLLKEHVQFGRVNLARTMLSFLDGSIVYVLAPMVGSLEWVAMWRVLMNLIMPAVTVSLAFSAVFTPLLARNCERARFTALAFVALICFVCGPTIYALLLILDPRLLLHLLFAGKYDALEREVPFVCLLCILYGTTMAFASIAYAVERWKILLTSQLVCTIILLSCTFPALWFFELRGAIAVLLTGEALKAFAMALLLKREQPKSMALLHGAHTVLRVWRWCRARRSTLRS